MTTRSPFELDPTLSQIRALQQQHHLGELYKIQAKIDDEVRLRHRAEPASLARALQQMCAPGAPGAGGGELVGAEKEFFAEAARLAGVPYLGHGGRVFVPWAVLGGMRMETHLLESAMRRDLTLANSAGYFVGETIGTARDLLRPWSVTARAGLEIMDGLTFDVSVPRLDTAPVVYPLPTDTSAITPSTPVLAGLPIAPRQIGCLVNVSGLLIRQTTPAVAEFLRRIMISAIGRYLDGQVLNGSGASGELQGLNHAAWSVATTSGASLGVTGVRAMKDGILGADADPSLAGWVATPAVQSLLTAEQQAASTWSPCWVESTAGDSMLGLRAFATTTAPAATLYVGQWDQAILALFGAGVEVEADAFTNFKTNVVVLRIVLACDFAVLRKGAFALATSVS